MIKDCNFKDYPFCNSNCNKCILLTQIMPLLSEVSELFKVRTRLNRVLEKKIKMTVDRRKKEGRINDLSNVRIRDNLYCCLKDRNKDDKVIINFFLNRHFRFSSQGIGLETIEECLNYIPSDFLNCPCLKVDERNCLCIDVNMGE
ncbi:MAG: hypothetical protein IKW90_06895 [Lachnospiraceae bacterium]|nr:hypothetical protein [Lachnospiraceae bacterium]